MPIGRTPGFSSRAISRQARRGDIDFGSTYEVHILLATRAKEWHSSLDAPLKDVHSLLHPCASIPDGPAVPVIFIAAVRMTLASIDSKITGCTSWGGDWRMQLAQAVWPIGCLLNSTSQTVGESVVLGSV